MKEPARKQANRTRRERAEKALVNGNWTIIPTDGGWRVQTPTDTYRVSTADEKLRCDCADNRRYGGVGVQCKHIFGVLLSQRIPPIRGQPARFPIQNKEKESRMTNSSTERMIERLQSPLDMARVKRRKAPGKGTVPYLQGHDVISVANEIFEFRWSFDLLSDPQVMIWDQVVTSYDQRARERVPVIDPETGQAQTQRTGIVFITGKVTIELGSRPYTHADVGRVAFTGDTPEALDTALAGAPTDCLKRCFRQLGDQFGLALYDKEVARTAGVGGPVAAGSASNGHSTGKRPRAGRPGSPVEKSPEQGMTVEQAKACPCPVGTPKNQQWANLPLGDVLAQVDGGKMLAYLAGDGFQANGDPGRQQAKMAARLLLQQGNGAI